MRCMNLVKYPKWNILPTRNVIVLKRRKLRKRFSKLVNCYRSVETVAALRQGLVQVGYTVFFSYGCLQGTGKIRPHLG